MKRKANKVVAWLTTAAMAVSASMLPLAASAATYKRGDVDLDGRVGITDVITICKCLMGAGTLSAAQATVADCDGVEGVTTNDALQILRYLVALFDDLGEDVEVEDATEPETTEPTEEETVEPTEEETVAPTEEETVEPTEEETVAPTEEETVEPTEEETVAPTEEETVEPTEEETVAPTEEETVEPTEEETAEGLTGVTEERTLSTDADGNNVIDLSNATKVEIAVADGTEGNYINGCFGYNDPVTGEWTQDMWEVTLDAEGNGIYYYDIPEGLTSAQVQFWYSSNDAMEDLTFTFTVERDPDTVLTGETEVRELDADSNLDVTGAEKIEIAITGGVAYANANGGLGYSDPETGDWTTMNWTVSFDADGNATTYITVPEGVTSLKVDTWYYGFGSDTYEAADLSFTFTVQLAEAE